MQAIRGLIPGHEGHQAARARRRKKTSTISPTSGSTAPFRSTRHRSPPARLPALPRFAVVVGRCQESHAFAVACTRSGRFARCVDIDRSHLLTSWRRRCMTERVNESPAEDRLTDKNHNNTTTPHPTSRQSACPLQPCPAAAIRHIPMKIRQDPFNSSRCHRLADQARRLVRPGRGQAVSHCRQVKVITAHIDIHDADADSFQRSPHQVYAKTNAYAMPAQARFAGLPDDHSSTDDHRHSPRQHANIYASVRPSMSSRLPTSRFN